MLILQDGMKTNADYHDNHIKLEGIKPDFMNHIYVGRCADSKEDCSHHAGKLSDVNVWSKPLTFSEMIDWTSCSYKMTGDLVNWSDAMWDVANMVEEFVETRELCENNFIVNYLVPGKRNINESLLLCHQFGGNVTVVRSHEQQTYLGNKLRSDSLCGADGTCKCHDML